MLKSYKDTKAFTIIEILIVISVIGILTGTTITMVNVPRQKAIAEDGAKSHTLKDIAESLETFYVAERKYPAQGTAKNPLDASAADNVLTATYLSSWPAGFNYLSDGTNFDVYVQKSTNTLRYFKYSSSQQKIRSCTNASIDTLDSCTVAP